jgi:hypothetical protein
LKNRGEVHKFLKKYERGYRMQEQFARQKTTILKNSKEHRGPIQANKKPCLGERQGS